MRTVEDALLLIQEGLSKHGPWRAYNGVLSDEWHRRFIENVTDRVNDGNSLSTEQTKIVLKILRKVQPYLAAKGIVSNQAIDSLISTPVYRKEPYQSSNVRKEVRFLGGYHIGFRFKFNDLIMRDLRDLSEGMQTDLKPWFDRDFRIWVVPVCDNLIHIRHIINTHRFEMDTAVRDYLALVEQSYNLASTVVVDDEAQQIIVNVTGSNHHLAGWLQQVAGGTSR